MALVGNQVRNQARQVVNTWRKQVNWNDVGNGANQAGVQLPLGSFITRVMVEIVTAFDGGASLILGTNANANNVVAAGDVNEAAIGVYDVTRGLGRSLTAAAVATLASRLTSAGGTVGQAEIVVEYEGNNG